MRSLRNQATHDQDMACRTQIRSRHVSRHSALAGRFGSPSRRGAMLVLVAVCMVILFIAAAFAIDIAYMHATRAELRTAVDAASRAGSEALGRLQSESAAVEAAVRMARANRVAGDPLELDPARDIILGSHQIAPDGHFEFVPGGSPTNSIQVIGRRTGDSPSGTVNLFFGGLFGRSEFQPVQQATACRLDRDIALVLDVSGSMNSFGRFRALQNAVSVFLDELNRLPQDEQVSLSVYSTSARHLTDLTTDFNLIRSDFSRERANGLTAIGEGLRTGIDALENSPDARFTAVREILLMTDGNHNRGQSPVDVIAEANAANITVNTITFSQGANQNLMRQVAQGTGGIHLHANNNAQLLEIFRQIARQVPVVLID